VALDILQRIAISFRRDKMDRKVILTEREAAYIITLLGDKDMIADFIEYTVGVAEAKEIEQRIQDKILLNLKP